MSLIIKGMQLPRKSEHRECSIAVVQNRPVSIAFSRTKTNPLECCECAEIPTPHGRLIDCESDFFPTAFRHNLTDYAKGWNTCLRSVLLSPTIIGAEE